MKNKLMIVGMIALSSAYVVASEGNPQEKEQDKGPGRFARGWRKACNGTASAAGSTGRFFQRAWTGEKEITVKKGQYVSHDELLEKTSQSNAQYSVDSVRSTESSTVSTGTTYLKGSGKHLNIDKEYLESTWNYDVQRVKEDATIKTNGLNKERVAGAVILGSVAYVVYRNAESIANGVANGVGYVYGGARNAAGWVTGLFRSSEAQTDETNSQDQEQN